MATQLPLYFEIPGNSLLNQILYCENGNYLTIYKTVLDSTPKDDVIKEMPPEFWSDKCYIDSEGNLNPVPFSKIRWFELKQTEDGNYILLIVDWTMSSLAGKILPAYFDDPDNKAHLAKILIDNADVENEDLDQYTINIAEFFSMTKKEQHGTLKELLKVSCYLKKIDLPNGGGSPIVRLKMPFVIIRGLRPIASEHGEYVFVDVDWYDIDNIKYRGLEGQRAAMALSYDDDLDFNHLTEEQQKGNVEALIKAGWEQDEEGNWYGPNGSLGGRKSKKSKNNKSSKNKKSYKSKKSYKKSNKTKSKKKNKRRGF